MSIKIINYNFKKYNFQKFLSYKFFNKKQPDQLFNTKLKKINLNKLKLEIKNLKNNEEFKQLYKEFINNVIKKLFNYKIYHQKFPNIRIFCSNDPNGLVPFHSDSWYNHSKGETNFWLPFHCVSSSESLQIINLKKSMILEKKILKKKLDISQINKLLISQAKPIKCNYGSFAMFSPFHIHGNVLNKTSYHRISMDFRIVKHNSSFKQKKLGGYFEIE